MEKRGQKGQRVGDRDKGIEIPSFRHCTAFVLVYRQKLSLIKSGWHKAGPLRSRSWTKEELVELTDDLLTTGCCGRWEAIVFNCVPIGKTTRFQWTVLILVKQIDLVKLRTQTKFKGENVEESLEERMGWESQGSKGGGVGS